MVTLRSLLFLTLMALSVVVYGSILVVIGRLLPFRARSRIARSWGRLVLWLLRISCGLKHEVVGMERLGEGPAIVMSNHQSAWETFALRALLPMEQTWVLKQELMRIPFFGAGLRQLGSIAIDRKAGRDAMRKLLGEGQEAVDQGRWIIVFPEGTRVAPGTTEPFSIGGALLAERSGVRVVPIAHNAGIFWQRRGIRKRPGVVRMVIGPPIAAKGRTAKQINADAEAWISGTVASLEQPLGAGRRRLGGVPSN